FISTATNSPGGLATEEPGLFGPLNLNFSLTYDNDPLESLDITSAYGTYDITGLTAFNYSVSDGPVLPLGIVFDHLYIVTPLLPVPPAVGLIIGGLGALLGFRRKA